MSRKEGIFIFPASLEVQIEGPLDARKYNKTFADLISAEKSSFYYKGMDAVVYDDPDETKNGIYFLKEKPSTDANNWLQLDTLKERTAETTTFDNTDTNLVAENVQTALVEINTKISSADIPIATPSVAGKVKIGDTLTVLSDGTIDITAPIILSGFVITPSDWIADQTLVKYSYSVTNIDNLEMYKPTVLFDKTTILNTDFRIAVETSSSSIDFYLLYAPSIDMVISFIELSIGGV